MIKMYLEEIRSLLENRIAPKIYNLDSEIYGFHYGSTQNEKIIKRVLLTVDITLESIQFALKNKINLIISIYPLISEPLTNFNQDLVNKLTLLSKLPITIFALNSPFIGAEGGIIDTLMEALYLQLDKILEKKNKWGIKLPIGRMCIPKKYINDEAPITLETLIKRISSNLKMKTVRYVGNIKKNVNKICITNIHFNFLDIIEKCLKNECDCLIITCIDYNLASYANNLGLSLIEISEFEINFLSIKKLFNILSLQYPHEEFFIFNAASPLKIHQ